jgi:eukaryotic-like serine/threonine-protein kinase
MNAPVVVGDVVAGKYRIDGALGRGGMGMVFSASHLFLPQRVAIKFLLASDSPGSVERFLREARAAVRLKGEHVVRVLDVGQQPSGLPYIVMEHLEGRDLSDVLYERGRLGVAEAVEYVLQACLAMAEAHALGIVHRDLKPANLFLTTAPDGTEQVKVLDFGISKELPSGTEEGPASLTQPHELLGSPIYMSPEQMRASRVIDARVDIWALGALLYRCVTGYPPFQALSFTELVLEVTGSKPRRPSEFRPDLPPALEAAVLRCLEKDPAERFPNVADLARAIAPFAAPGAQGLAERVGRVLRISLAPPREAGDTGRRASESGRFSEEATCISGSPVFEDAGSAPTERVVTGSAHDARPTRPALRGKAYVVAAGVLVVTAVVVGAVALGGMRPSPAEDAAHAAGHDGAGASGQRAPADPAPPAVETAPVAPIAAASVPSSGLSASAPSGAAPAATPRAVAAASPRHSGRTPPAPSTPPAPPAGTPTGAHPFDIEIK